MLFRLAIFGALASSLTNAQPTCNQRDGDYPGCGISKSTYSATDPLAGKAWLSKYFPVQTPGDECSNDVCSCSASKDHAAWDIQQGRVYTTREISPSGQAPPPGNGFGLHLVNVSAHLTTGGFSTSEVEAQFTAKLGDMTKFDSFMDFNVAFATSNLQGYKDTFKADGVKYLAGTWKDTSGKEYTSIIVQVPSTQLILELVQSASLSYADHEAMPVKLEQRVPSSTLSAQKARLSSRLNVSSSRVGSYIVSLVVNRAASTTAMSQLDEFYVSGMGTKKTHDAIEGGVTKKCFLWPSATVSVCFTNRPDSATSGSWKVGDFEKMLDSVHNSLIKGHPFCPMDKWEDNHYAIDSQTADGAAIIKYVNDKKPHHTCASHGVWIFKKTSLAYVFDPTGWGIQLDVNLPSAPSDCSSAATVLQSTGDSNPACTTDTSKCPSSFSLSLATSSMIV